MKGPNWATKFKKGCEGLLQVLEGLNVVNDVTDEVPVRSLGESALCAHVHYLSLCPHPSHQQTRLVIEDTQTIWNEKESVSIPIAS